MRLLWEDRAWIDYLYWQTQDKKTLKRINGLIKAIHSKYPVINPNQKEYPINMDHSLRVIA